MKNTKKKVWRNAFYAKYYAIIIISPILLLNNFLSLSLNKPSEGVSHEENWNFYPNSVRTAGFCGNPTFHLYWPNKNEDGTYNILVTRELIVQPGYILQFKVSNACYNHNTFFFTLKVVLVNIN